MARPVFTARGPDCSLQHVYRPFGHMWHLRCQPDCPDVTIHRTQGACPKRVRKTRNYRDGYGLEKNVYYFLIDLRAAVQGSFIPMAVGLGLQSILSLHSQKTLFMQYMLNVAYFDTVWLVPGVWNTLVLF
jgi:hypothetical protein